MDSQTRFALALCATTFLVACGGSGGSSDDSTPPPPLPATVQISKTPNQSVYGLGETVQVSTLVLDAAGNTMPNVQVTLASVPPADQQNGNQFVYLNDGAYTITATVQGSTQGGVPVTASTNAVVDGHGPTIACSSPFDGAILNLTPGTTVTLSGSVDDVNGVNALTVNGSSVAVGAAGAFSAPVTSVWGVNFVDLAATDGVGRQARRTCAFLLSDSFAAEGALLSDAISVKARQAAFDDGNTATLNSFADFLRTIVNSTGFRTTLDNALRAANPLKADSCDQSVTIPLVGTVCVVSSGVTYLGLDTPAGAFAGTGSLQLVNGGMASASHMSNLRFKLRVSGDVSLIPYDTTGFVTISFIDQQVVFDTTLSAGRPHVTVRPGTPAVSVGAITTDFSGLDGAVVNIVVGLANGTLRNIVSSQISNFITNNFNSTLDGFLGSLDVRNVGTSFAVPRFDGTSPLPVTFGVGFSSLNTNSTRMLFGVSSRFSATPAHSRPSLGAPVTSGARLLDSASTASMTTAVHMGLLNQALHALWRGGYFDSTLGGGAAGALVPPGASLALTANLPPALSVRSSGRIEIALGAVNLHVDYPALLGAPVDAGLGGRVSCAPSLNGNRLALGSCTVDELHVSTGRIVPDAQTQANLEDLLRPILNSILSTAANQALPALPLPNFRTPASLAQFGLPANADFGLVNPALSVSGNHAALSGSFGVQ